MSRVSTLLRIFANNLYNKLTNCVHLYTTASASTTTSSINPARVSHATHILWVMFQWWTGFGGYSPLKYSGLLSGHMKYCDVVSEAC